MLFLPHIPFFLYLIGYWLNTDGGNPYQTAFVQMLFLSLAAILILALHIFPYWNSIKISSRLKIMYGGGRILKLCRYGIILQLLFYLLTFLENSKVFPLLRENIPLLLGDLLFCLLYFYLLAVNGCIRILCTCRSLGIVRRLICLFFVFTPVINLFLLHYLNRTAIIEYDQELCRFETRKERDGSLPCATRYPLVMLHGIGFRDLRYLNYWGRIPKELTHYGAVVYYGHQEAWGTIENNARIIRDNIQKILEENHCDKVNLIAHSKGGLDARYLICGLHMEDRIASLTTISTPHRGSELIDLLNKLPDSVYRRIASLFDKSFRLVGDQKPDCYHASKQLSPGFCREFNEKYPNAPGIYYQSYASYMKHFFSDSLLSIPYLLMRFAGAGKNDGLVSETSARWGICRQTFVSGGRRGISHGDMIDLKREDYRGFDVLETYVQIVSDLKNKGF